MTRVGDDATPLPRSKAAWVAHPLAMWTDPAEDATHIGWARAFTADLKRFGDGGVYLNFIGDEGDDRIRSAFGSNYPRLAAIKAEYDPDNLFRLNHNIRPERRGEAR